MDRLSKAMPNKLDGEVLSQTDNKYLVAFWSCCQLERLVLTFLIRYAPSLLTAVATFLLS